MSHLFMTAYFLVTLIITIGVIINMINNYINMLKDEVIFHGFSYNTVLCLSYGVCLLWGGYYYLS